MTASTASSTNLYARSVSCRNKLDVSYYLQAQTTNSLNTNSINISYYLPSKNGSSQPIASLVSNKNVTSETSLEKYRSAKWNGKQVAAVLLGSACLIGLAALSILINPFIILAAPLVILTAMLAVRRLSAIDYQIVNIEENTITLSSRDFKLISDVKLPDVRLPDLEFVRYMLAGGNYQELLHEADRLIDAHLADDEYLGNLLSNLQIARIAHEEACYRRFLADPSSYSKEKLEGDIEADREAFVIFKEDLMQRAL